MNSDVLTRWGYMCKRFTEGEQDAGLTPVKRKTREDDWVEGVSNCSTVSSFSKVDGDSSSQSIKGVLYLIGRGCLSTPTMSVIGWEQPTRKNGLKANMMWGPEGQLLVLSVNYAPPAGDLIVVFSWPPSLV